MMDHDRAHDLLGIYALEALEPEDAVLLEAHLDECPGCRREARQLRAMITLVADSTPQVIPQPETRARVMARIRSPGPKPAPSSVARWALSAVAAALVLALVIWNLSLTSQLRDLRQAAATQQHIVRLMGSSSTQIVDLAGQGYLSRASGRAYVDERSHDIVLVTWRLNPLAADEVYQAWVIGESGPVSAGLFTVNANGWVMTTLAVPEAGVQFDTIGISLEPAGGSQQPTRVVLLGGY